MHFVDNSAWFAVLLSIHIIGAIVGIGPSFTFGLLGPLAGRVGGQGAVALLRGVDTIEKVMNRPVLLGTQWITGVLLIFNRGLDHNFFTTRRTWLLVSIGLYILVVVLAQAVSHPTVRKMIAAGEEGDFAAIGRYSAVMRKIGPIFPVALITIMVLMVWKPGSGCGALLRC